MVQLPLLEDGQPPLSPRSWHPGTAPAPLGSETGKCGNVGTAGESPVQADQLCCRLLSETILAPFQLEFVLCPSSTRE